MSKIIIETKENNSITVTYDNGKLVYPICDVDNDKFHISETTDNIILTLISDVIYQCGQTLKCKIIEQRFVNKTLNKPSDCK